MTLFNTILTAWNGIMGNKLRATLTTLGIVIGVASVISMLALGNGARAAVDANFRHLGSDMVQIAVKQKIDQGELVPIGEILSFEDGLQMPEGVPLVQRVIMSVGGDGKIRRDRNVLDMGVIGSTADGLANLISEGRVQPVNWPDGVPLTPDAFLGDGRFFTPSEVIANADVCVLGHKTATDLFEGDPPMDELIWVNRRKCLVIGVLAELETINPSQRNQLRPNEILYLPISTAIQNLFDEEPSVQIIARVSDEAQMATARQEIIAYLRQRHGRRAR